MLPITALFAILLTLIGSYLAFRAGSLRGKEKISIGDGGNEQLLLEMRRHGNFSEFVPLALILMAIVELNGGNAALLYACGGLLVLARILHPMGLQAGKDALNNPLRGLGAGGTLLATTVLLLAAGWGLIS